MSNSLGDFGEVGNAAYVDFQVVECLRLVMQFLFCNAVGHRLFFVSSFI